jgi:hypothetical protein
MKVTFNSYSEVAALQNSFLFAMHKQQDIDYVRQLQESRGDQMQHENEVWLKAQHALCDAKPDVEYEINLL